MSSCKHEYGKQYSPKRKTMYHIEQDGVACDITATLRLKWTIKAQTDTEVTLQHRNILLTIDKASFESDWRELTNTGAFSIAEKIEEIWHAHNGKIDNKEIAEILNISPSTVRKYIPVEGKELDVGMLCALADNGWNLEQLRTEAEYQTKRSYANDEIIKVMAERGYRLK